LIESKGLNAVGCRTPLWAAWSFLWVETLLFLVEGFTNGIFIDDYYFVLMICEI
jgi:hypothetical protein